MPKQALPGRLNATSSEIQSVERALRFPTSTKSVAYGRFTNTTGVRIIFLITLQFFLSKTGSIALQTGNLVTLTFGPANGKAASPNVLVLTVL